MSDVPAIGELSVLMNGVRVGTIEQVICSVYNVLNIEYITYSEQ